MSLKSRLRSKKRASEKQNVDVLEIRKKKIKVHLIDSLLMSLFLLLILIGEIVLGVKNLDIPLRLLIYAPVVLFFMFYFYNFLRCIPVYSGIRSIKYSSEQTVKIVCVKVSSLIHAVTRNDNEIICLILTDELGKKYYFACGPDDSGEAMKIRIVNSELTLICYKDTNVVKRIDEERNLYE